MIAFVTKTRIAALALAAGVVTSRTAAAHHRHCSEVSTVIGFERCSRFGGGWSLPDWVPAFSLDVGAIAHRFDTQPLTMSERGDVAARRVGARPTTTMTAATIALGMKATIHGWFYTGPEMEFGGAVGPSVTPEAAPNGLFPNASFFAARWVAGIQGRTGALSIGGEIAAGVRAIDLMIDAQPQPTFAFQEGAVLEARLRASVWVLPWITLGASFGTSLLARRDVSLGVFVAAHSRPFAGRRASPGGERSGAQRFGAIARIQ